MDLVWCQKWPVFRVYWHIERGGFFYYEELLGHWKRQNKTLSKGSGQYHDSCIVSANYRQFCKVQVVGAVDVGYVGRKLRKVRNNLCLKPIWQSSSHLRGVQSHPALSHPMRTELGFFFSVNMLVWACVSHSSYLSQLPQPAVVYFFLAGVLFSIENAKCWPNLANFDQFWLFCREFTEFFGVLFIDLNNAAVY